MKFMERFGWFVLMLILWVVGRAIMREAFKHGADANTLFSQWFWIDILSGVPMVFAGWIGVEKVMYSDGSER